MNKKQQLQLIWRHTHPDFRGIIENVPSVLVLREGGTTLVRLDCLTDKEIDHKFRFARDHEERRLAKLAKTKVAIAHVQHTDAEIDLWNNAALAALRGQPCPASDAHSTDGYQHGLREAKVKVGMPSRPEGYYHSALEPVEEAP